MEMKEGKDGLWYGLITLISLVMIWKAVVLLWLRPKKIERLLRKQGFKGNPYKPIIGDVKDLIKYAKASLSTPIGLSDDHLPRLLGFIHTTIDKHGDNCFLWIGPIPWLIITDHEKIKEVLTKHEDFQKPNHPFTKLLLVGLFGLEGNKWAKQKKIINPAFHVEKLKNMFDAVYQSCSVMMSAWEEIVSREGEGSTELDVMPHIVNLTGDIISRAAFGSSYEQGKQIFELQEQLIGLCMGFHLSNYIPGWSYLPTKKNRRGKQICNEVEELLTRMIDSRKKELEVEGRGTKDLLGILLESNMREIKEHGNAKEDGLTTEEVVQECKLFYLAGSETTSSLLVWTLILLSKHRTWQERARDEVLLVFGKDEKPNFEELSHLKVVSMIIYEVFRLYPAAYMFLRTVYKEKHLREWLIPAGTEIVLPTCIIHQDRNIWGKDAKEFNPERFSEGVSKAMNGQGAFFPFSTGPRSCIGQNFALLEAKLSLTMILQRFSFDLSPSYTHAPRGILTVQPQHGANLILHKLY